MNDRLKAIIRPTAMKPTIKRKVGYNTLDDEVSEARKKMINISMNDCWYWFHIPYNSIESNSEYQSSSPFIVADKISVPNRTATKLYKRRLPFISTSRADIWPPVFHIALILLCEYIANCDMLQPSLLHYIHYHWHTWGITFDFFAWICENKLLQYKIIQFQFHISWLHIWIGPQVLCIDDVYTCVEEVECKQVQKQADE